MDAHYRAKHSAWRTVRASYKSFPARSNASRWIWHREFCRRDVWLWSVTGRTAVSQVTTVGGNDRWADGVRSEPWPVAAQCADQVHKQAQAQAQAQAAAEACTRTHTQTEIHTHTEILVFWHSCPGCPPSLGLRVGGTVNTHNQADHWHTASESIRDLQLVSRLSTDRRHDTDCRGTPPNQQKQPNSRQPSNLGTPSVKLLRPHRLTTPVCPISLQERRQGPLARS